jgi:DNA-directed RNA polymerase specialized sigma24 family protein
MARPVSISTIPKIFFSILKRNSGAMHYSGVTQKRDQKLGDAVGTAVARIDQELSLTKPVAAEDAQPKGKYKTFQALVMQALQLRRTHREVFILCDIRGYSVAETASMLDISAETVVRRLARARNEMGFDGEDDIGAITELIDI